MFLGKIFDGMVGNGSTVLGGADLTGYSRYSVLMRVDNAQNNNVPFTFQTYHNNMEILQEDFYTIYSGFYNHHVVYDIFHPHAHFILKTGINSANVKLWVYAACCESEEMENEFRILNQEVRFTKIGMIRTKLKKPQSANKKLRKR